MVELREDDIAELYSRFSVPICGLDCSSKCAPYNTNGIPFCCDTRCMVATAYDIEWEYLQKRTDLWHTWEPRDREEKKRLASETPENQVLLECLGHERCKREYRTLTCRSFPFFPYFDSRPEFIGFSYYRQYTEYCWVINNLDRVSDEFANQFIAAYETLFSKSPSIMDSFVYHSMKTRAEYVKERKVIWLFHRNGEVYKISPKSERMRKTSAELAPKFGAYKVAAEMPFLNEVP